MAVILSLALPRVIGELTYPLPGFGAHPYHRVVLRTPAQAALAAGEWDEAVVAAERVLAENPEDADALDVLGEARWMQGDRRRGVEYRRRAYAAHRRAGNLPRAAWLAVYIAGEHRLDGDAAAGNGWLARARRLLDGLGADVPERGWLEVEEAKRAASADEAERHAQVALEIAQATGSTDVEVCALCQLGLARVLQGDIDRGLGLLDEAMAAALAGETTEWLCVGDACCTTLVACDQLADLQRSVEWCRVVTEWAEHHNFLPIQSWCRAIYGGVLTRAGNWRLAEQVLIQTLRSARPGPNPGPPLARARLAALRIRQGRIEEAEQLLERCEDHPAALEPVVEVSIQRGTLDVAGALVEERLMVTSEPAQRLDLLELLCRVRLAQGEFGEAMRLVDGLRELGRQLRREEIVAAAELAAGRVCLARSDDAAPAHLEDALHRFAALGLPLEEGRARLELARWCAASGSPRAAAQARAACEIFERLGASRDADEAAALLRRLGGSGRSARRGAPEALTSRELEVLDLLTAGLSNPEIAERLVITRKTAEHHVGKILAKLDVRNRAEAVALALQQPGDQMRRS